MSDAQRVMEALTRMSKKLMAKGQMELPPPIFRDMQGEILELNLDAQVLVARFPVLERYQNPLGYMQGGMIAAAIDNTTGPLAFLVGPPSVTRTMSLKFRRPVTPDMSEITVTAGVSSIDERQLVMAATVKDEHGKLLAEASAVHAFIRVRPRPPVGDQEEPTTAA